MLPRETVRPETYGYGGGGWQYDCEQGLPQARYLRPGPTEAAQSNAAGPAAQALQPSNGTDLLPLGQAVYLFSPYPPSCVHGSFEEPPACSRQACFFLTPLRLWCYPFRKWA